MDIFNTKRVTELEEALAKTQRDLSSLRTDYTHLQSTLEYTEKALDAALQSKNSVPEDCVPGAYCSACKFSKGYYYPVRSTLVNPTWRSGFICNKGKTCQNFIQKEIKND